ncbi:hypothetical protein Patl1_25708 [Pistacia atlantica]|uniref:Uncharacterized protein n=1 Tax=Pistacia atlantica TaxID=434234 RepID=A0ACC1B1Q7_9ROSI|nr:hypothetical protein Patl1_25708 [Pistacia atlantica]
MHRRSLSTPVAVIESPKLAFLPVKENPLLSFFLVKEKENPLPLLAFGDSPISIDGDNTKHVPFHGSPNHNLTTLADSSYPGSYSPSAFSESHQETDFGLQGLTKALSEGNLEGLIAYNSEEFQNSTYPEEVFA